MRDLDVYLPKGRIKCLCIEYYTFLKTSTTQKKPTREELCVVTQLLYSRAVAVLFSSEHDRLGLFPKVLVAPLVSHTHRYAKCTFFATHTFGTCKLYALACE